MNSKHAFLALSVFTFVSIAHGEREVFAPTKLAPTATAGTVQFGDGTVAAPSITFSADNNTGFFRNGNDQIGYSLGGVTRGLFSGTELYVGGGTTSATPSNGTIRTTSGSGTNIAGGNLTIQGGNSTGNAAGGYVAFQTAAAGASGSTPNTLTERVRIASNGELYIGNGEVAASTVNGNIRATGGSGTNINGADLILHGGRSTGNAVGGAVRFFTAPAGASGSSANASTERMRISSTGRVGIGTTNPAAALHVVQSNLALQFRVQDVETDSTNKFGTFATGHYTNSEEPVAALLVSNTSTANSINIGGGSGSFNAATQLVFTTAANNTTAAGTERMRITSTGVMQMASGSYIDAGAGKFELPNGTAIPATCTVGELFQDTDSDDCANTGGGDGALCICKATNTWALISNF